MELTDRNRQILCDVAQGFSPVESQDKRGLNSLSFQNIRTLLPGCWLSDEVIDEYLSLLKRRKQACDSGLQCKFMSTQFFTKLPDEGYDAITRWLDRAGLDRAYLDKCDFIIFPIHTG